MINISVSPQFPIPSPLSRPPPIVQFIFETPSTNCNQTADDIFSAATSLPTPTSKPDPAIYIHAMKVLSVTAEECVAVEDSKSGATAAFRANIKTIGYTGAYEKHEVEKMRKVLTDAGCVVVMNDWTEFEACLKGI